MQLNTTKYNSHEPICLYALCDVRGTGCDTTSLRWVHSQLQQ